MSDWDTLIPRCFGAEDLVCGGTSEELAAAWLRNIPE
jgi:hypothetical protein